MARVSTRIPSMADKDKDTLFVCPYNKYHTITAMKYPGHLTTCRKQYTGDSFARCPFNARHEFPAVEYDYHVSCCPDKSYIEKETAVGYAPNVPAVNHFPEWNNITPSEDWESEADHVSFSITGNPYEEQDRTAYDVMEDFQDELEMRADIQIEVNSQTATARDMSGLSKAQKKNLKRAEKRREKHVANGATSNDDEDDEQGNQELSEVEKNQLLSQIAREYSRTPIRQGDAFVDWVSILNQYCQKNHINQPKYKEASNPHGGFGSAVTVTTEVFLSDSYADTKKKAKHSAARAALLGLKIPVSMPDPCRAPHAGGGSRNIARAQELEMRSAFIENKMAQTQQNRVIPGHNPASNAQTSSQTQQVTRQMGAVSLEKQSEDEWQVAAGRRRAVPGTNNLKLAGIGRGRARR